MHYEIEWPPRPIPRTVVSASGNQMIYEVSLWPRPGEEVREVGTTIGCHRGHRTNLTVSRRFSEALNTYKTWNSEATSSSAKALSNQIATQSGGKLCLVCASAYRLMMQAVFDYDRVMLSASGDALRMFSAAGRMPMMVGDRKGRSWTFLRTMDAVLARLFLYDADSRLRIPYFGAVALVKQVWSSREDFESARALLNLADDAGTADMTERAQQFITAFMAMRAAAPPPIAKSGGALHKYITKKRGAP